MACFALQKGCKRVEEKLDWAFNWTHELARKWQPDMSFASGVKIRPSFIDEQTGLQYSSSGGQSGSEEPEWPTTLGGTVTEGSITWTAEALTLESLADQIDTSEWDADMAITVSGDSQVVSPGLQATYAFVSGGLVRRTYDVVNKVTTLGGRILDGVLRLRIDG